MLKQSLTTRQLLYIEIFIGALFCFIPLFFNNPYRINIFLSWEGAYRISEGQMPFYDFYLPMGYGYWLIPAFFFKVFGPFMHSLIKAQVLINLLSIVAFRSILSILKVKPEVILFSVLVFCISYVSKNFWPWYNHTVVVFELIGFALILYAIIRAEGWKIWLGLSAGALFIFLSFFTKQDIGGMAILISLAIVAYDAIITKSIKKAFVYGAALTVIAMLFIIPLLSRDFLYWFNYGQAPHESRLVLSDFLNHWIGWAYWEKFLVLMMVVLMVNKFQSIKDFFYSKENFLFAMLCLAMILEGLVVHVTSPVPPGNELFFYSFGFAYIFGSWDFKKSFDKPIYIALVLGLIIFWWTGVYWRNLQRFVTAKPAVVEKTEKTNATKYRIAKEFKSLDKLYLSEKTIEGIHQVMDLDIVKNKKDLKVLNMTELTSLAYEMKFTLPVNQTMWYHQGVSLFQKQIDEFCKKIAAREYDLVMFQDIPHTEVVNFFPEDVKKCLEANYHYEFTFLAPRTPEDSFIHVFTKPALTP